MYVYCIQKYILHTHTHSCTITNISGLWRHTTKKLIFYQITLFTDCLKTLMRYLHPQQYAGVDAYSNCSVDCMPYYTHYIHKGTHHYVRVYGLSDYSCHCMSYYTHHKHKGAHHCVCVDVLSDCPFY